jgi:hypothetical protein
MNKLEGRGYASAKDQPFEFRQLLKRTSTQRRGCGRVHWSRVMTSLIENFCMAMSEDLEVVIAMISTLEDTCVLI